MYDMLPLLRARIFGTPLLMHERKLRAIASGLGPRFGLRPMAFDEDDYEPRPRVARKPYTVTPQGVALVPVLGVLVNRGGQVDALSTTLRSYTGIASDLETAMADSQVTSIVLDIDSPGGEATGCFELAERIFAMRGSKPIVAAAGGDAYSAAYAIASAASRLLVMPSGGVGSIGVVAMHVDQSGADAKAGLAFTYLYAGAHKVDGNPHQPLSDQARAEFTADIDRLYGDFTQLVARNRGIPEAAVRATEARCLAPADAIAASLADQVGTLADAVALAAQLAAASPRRPPTTGASSRPRSMKEPRMNEDEIAQAAAEQAQRDQAAAASRQATALAEARTAAASDAAAILDLCMLAGRPQDAAEHIRAGRTRGEVSEALLRARASSDAPTSTHHQLKDTAPVDPADPDGWEGSTRRVCGTVRQGV